MWDQFDEKTAGCPLVALKKTCAQMRVDKTCPKFMTFSVVDMQGIQSLKGACADFALPVLMWEAAGNINRVQAAVESSRNDQTKNIAALGNFLSSVARTVHLHDRALRGPQLIEGQNNGSG